VVLGLDTVLATFRDGTEFLAEFRIVYEFLFLSGIHELQNA
jgi:hypothetical protein